MKHIHHQPLLVDYRLRMPRSIQYAGAAGGAALALGMASRAGMPAHWRLAGSLIGVGATVLAPALTLWSFVKLLQTARDRLRDLILASVEWRGDEAVLDVGTGSGFLVLACAKQLPGGKGTGIDIYDPHAGGGSAEIFWRNARAEGVAEHVELLNIDARQMTFADEMFDVTVSSLAMHHMGGAEDRRRATEEIVRTLKPSGTVAICDVKAVIGDCEQTLRDQGMHTIRRRDYLHLFSILSAKKS